MRCARASERTSRTVVVRKATIGIQTVLCGASERRRRLRTVAVVVSRAAGERGLRACLVHQTAISLLAHLL
jgi:hypothetical protein